MSAHRIHPSRRASDRVDVDKLFAGDGAMVAHMRAKDWSATALGPVESWATSLRTAVSLCLGASPPIALAWGPRHALLYNDAYARILGGDPSAQLGLDFSACWARVSPVVAAAFSCARVGGPAVVEDVHLFVDREGSLTEAFFTFSFTPVLDEAGVVGGLFNPCIETTPKVLGERRARVLAEVAARVAETRTVDEVFAGATNVLAGHTADVPFALIYRLDAGGTAMRLAARTGWDPERSELPQRVSLADDEDDPWCVRAAFRSGEILELHDLEARIDGLHGASFPKPPKTALLLPIVAVGHDRPVAILVAGVSPRLVLDAGYRDFHRVLAAVLTHAVANAHAHECALADARAMGAAIEARSGVATPARILFADDDEIVRQHVCRVLQTHWQVEAVEDGDKALRAARTEPPDLIVTDVSMPYLDGFALLRELRKDPRTRSIPVVMLSARGGAEAGADGLQSGAEDYLAKPFSSRELLARVNVHLQLAQLRKELELGRRRLYDLFMQAPVAICVLRGPDLIYEMANPLYCKITGGRELLGRPLAQAIPELEQSEYLPLLRGVMSTGEVHVGTSSTPCRYRRDPAGEIEETHWTFCLAPLRSESGAVDRVMAVAHETTAQVLAAQEREHYIAELRRTVHVSELFVGVLGHDLRNPLCAIQTAASLLALRDDEAVTKLAHRILDSSERMGKMIEQLLDFTRIRLGRGLTLSRKPTDLGGLCRSIVDELEAAHGRAIAVETVGDLVGEWDRDRLAQVLSNLGGNACEHGSRDAPVSIRLDGSAADTVTLEVRNGGRLPPALVSGLFEPFGATQARPSARKLGLGLGLYISRSIVIGHGGELVAHSDEVDGTRFVASLPRRVVAKD